MNHPQIDTNKREIQCPHKLPISQCPEHWKKFQEVLGVQLTDSNNDQKLENLSSSHQVDTNSEQQDLEQIVFGVIDAAATYAVESDDIEPERIQAICDVGKAKVSAWHHRQLEAKNLPWLTDLTCPACGSTGFMFVAKGGYVTCSVDTCPNSDYNAALKAMVEAKVAEARKQGWHLRGKRVNDMNREELLDEIEFLAAATRDAKTELNRHLNKPSNTREN